MKLSELLSLNGKTVNQAANETGLTPSTVKNYVYRLPTPAGQIHSDVIIINPNSVIEESNIPQHRVTTKPLSRRSAQKSQTIPSAERNSLPVEPVNLASSVTLNRFHALDQELKRLESRSESLLVRQLRKGETLVGRKI